MKIVHVTSFFQAGMGYQENCLAPAQARLGHDVCILTSDRLPSHAALMKPKAKGPNGSAPGREQADGVAVVRLPAAWHWRKHNWVYVKGLWDEVQRQKPDIVHTHNFVTVPAFQVLWRNRRGRYPMVVDDHNNYFNIHPYNCRKHVLYGFVKHLFLPLVMRRVGRVLPMSEEVRRLVCTEYGVSESLTTLVYLGADAERFRRDEEAGGSVRAALGIPEDAIVIVNAGKITAVKDNHVLLEAMAQVAKQAPQVRLLMIGNAPDAYRDRLRAIMDANALGDNVHWVDFVANRDLPGYYSASDIGVWPGDWSNTVLEAAACSVPLVLPGREYAGYSMGNENGLAFERGNVRDLARALLKLATDENLRRGMAQRSRELIETSLNWDVLARQTIEIYAEVIAASV